MKTPDQWLEIIHQRGATTQPAGTLRLIQQIQDDALLEIRNIIAESESNSHQGSVCTLIKLKRMAAMPNAEPSRREL